MKPRLRFIADLNMWECHAVCTGLGDTPELAYADWRRWMAFRTAYLAT